ncbi:MAG: glutamine-hydrolyzing carbamoyl-phosphate synthase small subunit [Patescibacteria group bacterium]
MGEKREYAYLHLEDGTLIQGFGFGYRGGSSGEVIFTTGMTGYPESLTDPSFAGQILTFTYPLLGNYGVPKPKYLDKRLLENFESERIWVNGIVVAEITEKPSHHKLHQTLDEWLKQHRIPGIKGIDTRALTILLREKGVMRGRITRSSAKIATTSDTTHYVSETSLTKIQIYNPKSQVSKTIALIDCGVKHGILRALLDQSYRVVRVPWNVNPLELGQKIDGVVCANGPGDPKECGNTVANIRKVLVARIPFLGICLGHQLLALAIGADTYKLKYGHRGLNQPCQDTISKKAYVTSQNHGYAVNARTLPSGFKEWFVNLNDGTNEGIIHKDGRVKSVQFHPEGCPGPFDAIEIFSHFKKLSS